MSSASSSEREMARSMSLINTAVQAVVSLLKEVMTLKSLLFYFLDYPSEKILKDVFTVFQVLIQQLYP